MQDTRPRASDATITLIFIACHSSCFRCNNHTDIHRMPFLLLQMQQSYWYSSHAIPPASDATIILIFFACHSSCFRCNTLIDIHRMPFLLLQMQQSYWYSSHAIPPASDASLSWSVARCSCPFHLLWSPGKRNDCREQPYQQRHHMSWLHAASEPAISECIWIVHVLLSFNAIYSDNSQVCGGASAACSVRAWLTYTYVHLSLWLMNRGGTRRCGVS